MKYHSRTIVKDFPWDKIKTEKSINTEIKIKDHKQTNPLDLGVKHWKEAF